MTVFLSLLRLGSIESDWVLHRVSNRSPGDRTPSEPNNCSGIEHYMAYFVPPDARAGLWNDFGTSDDPPGVCGCGTCDAGVFTASLLCEFDCESACGDPAAPEGSVSASDALFILTAAVGQASCALCTCDVDGSGAIVASDALRTLAFAVGQPVTLECP